MNEQEQDIENMRRVLMLTQKPRQAVDNLELGVDPEDTAEFIDKILDQIEEHASDVYHNMMRRRRNKRGEHVYSWE